jgi:Tn3 transposase DDE domain
LSSWEFS